MHGQPLPTVPLIVMLWFALIAVILYLLALQNALRKCAPGARTMKPGKVWLCLIPVFGLIWQFILVRNIAKSLRGEFARRGIPCPERTPGQNIGLTMSACHCCAFIPWLGPLAAIAGIVLWILYWKKIANYSRVLDAHETTTPASPIA
jgi:hypothetical protein